MRSKLILVALPAALFISANGGAIAGQTINEAGVIVCVNDKWDEQEPEKGHKLVDAVQRCVLVPDDATAPKAREECVGKFEYLPDGSWKGAGTCTNHYTDGDTTSITWEEGSHLKEYTYKFTGGTGKYKDVTGAGTYTYESLSDTLFGGKYKGQLLLP